MSNQSAFAAAIRLAVIGNEVLDENHRRSLLQGLLQDFFGPTADVERRVQYRLARVLEHAMSAKAVATEGDRENWEELVAATKAADELLRQDPVAAAVEALNAVPGAFEAIQCLCSRQGDLDWSEANYGAPAAKAAVRFMSAKGGAQVAAAVQKRKEKI